MKNLSTIIVCILALTEITGCKSTISTENDTIDIVTENFNTEPNETDTTPVYPTDEESSEEKSDKVSEVSIMDSNSTNQLQAYQNDKLDIIFDYPQDWEFPEEESWKEDNLFLRNNNLMIFGIADGYNYEGHPMSDIEQCAVAKINPEWSCGEGCEEIIEGVYVTQKSSRNGDASYSIFASTDLSMKYPSICFQLPMGLILYELAEKDGIEYWQVTGYDIPSMIENREFSDEVMNEIDDFIALVKTIRVK